MPNREPWWKHWAPYWDALEDRHLGTLIADSFVDTIVGPVLVVGGGQGVVIEHLQKKGLEVYGIDLEPEMIRQAKKRRNIQMLLADAAHLPFEDGAFKTVIIATGIVDYMSDETTIKTILSEANRVTQNNGDLLITFYKLDPRTERINRRLGVIGQDGKYHLNRLFHIVRMYQEAPFKPVKKLAEWSGKPRGRTAIYWGWLGMTLPASMRREQKIMTRIFERAKADGIDPKVLHETVPGGIPYRSQEEIHTLLKNCGLSRYMMHVHVDCIVARHHKFSALEGITVPDTHQAKDDQWIIKTKNLKKSYTNDSVYAVDALNIEIEQGTIFGILGPNGAGKTTTLSMLCGLIRPTGGEIAFSDILKNDIKKRLGYVPQELALYDRMTARDNLKFFGNLYGIPGKTLQKRIDALLELTSLRHRAGETISNFSQGMMRRLNLATGLLHDPIVVLMDEPTVGIDPQSRNRIYDAIFHLKNKGTTILYTTHYMEEAKQLCDRIAIMDHGRVILNDEPVAAVEKFGVYRIEFTHESGNVAPLIRELKTFPFVEAVSFEEGRVAFLARIGKQSAQTILKVEQAAKRHGVVLSLKNVIEPSLESLFLDITGRDIRDTKGD